MSGMTVKDTFFRSSPQKAFGARISFGKLDSLKEESGSKFVMPVPQEALDGRLGLSLVDIASSIEMQHDDLLKKFTRSGEKSYLEFFGQEARYHKDSEVSTYILDVRAAISFVAKYSNFSARYFLNMLIDFETDRLFNRYSNVN